MIGETNSSAKQGFPDVITTVESCYDNVTISANSYYTYNGNPLSLDGYLPLGIVGINLQNASSSGSNSSKCAPSAYTINQTDHYIYVRVGNFSSSSAKVKLDVIVLWVRVSD